jgi:hypothetical protein
MHTRMHRRLQEYPVVRLIKTNIETSQPLRAGSAGRAAAVRNVMRMSSGSGRLREASGFKGTPGREARRLGADFARLLESVWVRGHPGHLRSRSLILPLRGGGHPVSFGPQ